MVFCKEDSCLAHADYLQDAATLHLSYHDSEHYNSVRSADDMGGEPATPIMLASSTAQVKKVGFNLLPRPHSVKLAV